MYGHDQDLAGWIIKDIVVNNHWRLIGQETSSQGLFIGPLYYYLEIPFYWLTHMDPKGALLLSFLLGGFAIYSFYYVFTKIFNKNVGLIASLIYSLSLVIVFTDREVAPTMPVMLWSVWFFYAIYRLLKGDQKQYILFGILLGLVWHLNLGLIVLTPLIILAQIFSRKKLDFKKIFLGLVPLVILVSPFIVFSVHFSIAHHPKRFFLCNFLLDLRLIQEVVPHYGVVGTEDVF
jgi:4-amino-4-deoxy-L-arabinose transferase-like glycosyltransferase